MRYSELAGKEIIDLAAGARLGVVDVTDLVIDTDTGRVEAIIVPQRRRLGRGELVIPWKGIKKIGEDLTIIDLSALD